MRRGNRGRGFYHNKPRAVSQSRCNAESGNDVNTGGPIANNTVQGNRLRNEIPGNPQFEIKDSSYNKKRTSSQTRFNNPRGAYANNAPQGSRQIHSSNHYPNRNQFCGNGSRYKPPSLMSPNNGTHCHGNHSNEGRYRTNAPNNRPNRSRTYPIGFKALHELLTKPSDDIVVELLREGAGYQILLNGTSIEDEKMLLLFKVLGKASKAITSRENLTMLLSQTFCEGFTLLIVSSIVKFKQLDLEAAQQFYNNLFEVCSLYKDTRPYESVGKLSGIFEALIMVLESRVEDFSGLSEKCKCAKEEIEVTQKKMTEIRSKEHQSLLNEPDDIEPPDDFRLISVLPTTNDINQEFRPFLRRNIIEGKYKDAHHYLDVQFRLLREDFIRPLREGISHFRNKENKTRNRDLTIYKNVNVEKSELINREFIYYVKLNLPKHLKVENSKRLLFGNLLCFSNDGFKTLNFGHVCDRKIEKFKQGLVGVKFDAKAISFKGSYDMAESRAYFVAYQHVLEALKLVNDDQFPLPHYIIEVSKDLFHPDYMDRTTNYDMRVIRGNNLMNKSVAKGELNLFKTTSKEPGVEYFAQLGQVRALTDIINWPSSASLVMDDSQRQALYGALTHQLAIIQGPPGTGKTFLGLKITQILLHNTVKWNKSNSNIPILVVCYTNHALDQFLEGMITFTSNIVRVGSRSKNETISQFQINNLSRLAHQNRYFPKNVHKRSSELAAEVSNLENLVTTSLQEFNELKNPKGIISFHILKKVIPEHIIPQLKNVGSNPMEEWLLNNSSEFQNDENDEYGHFQHSESANSDFLADEIEKVAISENSNSDESDSENDVWEDANDLIEEEELNRMVFDFDVKVEEKKKINLNYLYELSLMTLYHFINSLETYVNDPNMNPEDYDVELGYKLHISKGKLELMQMGLQMKIGMDSVGSFKNEYVNIFKLNFPQRWQLYQSWVKDYRERCSQELPGIISNFNRKSRALTEMRSLEYLFIMRNAAVVGMTTTGAAKYNKLIQSLSPSIVIIEEAAEILESHVITSLTSGCKHLILIGDHQQLRPSTTVYELAIKYNLETSLFERMIKNGVRYETLEYQHRMRPEISKLLVPTIYPNLKDDDSVNNRDDIKGITKNMYFISHTFLEKSGYDDNVSHENEHEAHFLMALCQYLLLQGYDSESITILTPYSGQFFLLKKVQRDHRLCSGVKICIVDNFQGEENDIILLSLVRSNVEGNVGFLKIENRVCVAISRAKYGMYIIGNMEQLTFKSNLWVKIQKTLVEEAAIGPTLTLRCENHPDQITIVSNGNDIFTNCPEGGCLKPCMFHFENCSHSCPRTCHARDMDHKNVKCQELCSRKICDNDDHYCQKKCWVVCGPCCWLVMKDLPCQHQHSIECHIDPNEYPCPTEVARDLECGHNNMMPCHANTKNWKCSHMCDTRLDCGHQCKLPCHRKEDPDHGTYKCTEPCTLLNKGCTDNHECKKKCYQDCGDCNFLVDKLLSCGHTHSKVQCFKTEKDIICTKRCGNTLDCGHPCQTKCCEPCGGCIVIVEKTIPECNHKIKVECGKPPTSGMCKDKCPRFLDCGHKCRGLCKNPCTVDCQELVPTILKCPKNHQVKVPCHIRGKVKAEESWLQCRERCQGLLSCGHICKGKCGDCFTGRVHVPCNENCGKALVCGHVCKQPCSQDCPPCEEMCEWKCKHSRCRKKCAIPCQPCKERCTWECPHEKCKRKCGDVCSRRPCEKPCDKKLVCGHPCIGFCGDPCPRLCRKCNFDELTEFVLLGTEDEEDARFVMLEDCQHVIEAKGLEKWLQMNDSEIGMKKCPRCKKAIFNCLRYNKIVKKTYKDVENVKRKYFTQSSASLKDNIKEILNDVDSSGYYTAEAQELKKKIGLNQRHSFYAKKNQYSDTLLRLVHFQATILLKSSTLQDQLMDHIIKNYNSSQVLASLKLLILKVMNLKTRVSSQTAEEVVMELQRMSILPSVEKVKVYKDGNNIISGIYMQLDKLIDPTIKFDSVLEKKVRSLLKEAESFCGGLGIPESEKQMVLSAMGLKQGHWYKCPNGHIYCITECGGAMQVSECPDCKAPIGGQNHRLIGDNAVASEMDGASQAAWPQGPNILDYDI